MSEEKIDYEIEDIGFKNHLLKIDELYAFVSEDATGEGVCGLEMVIDGRLMLMAMVCADKDRVKSLMPHAQNMVRRGHKKIKLIKFTNREEIQEIEG